MKTASASTLRTPFLDSVASRWAGSNSMGAPSSVPASSLVRLPGAGCGVGVGVGEGSGFGLGEFGGDGAASSAMAMTHSGTLASTLAARGQAAASTFASSLRTFASRILGGLRGTVQDGGRTHEHLSYQMHCVVNLVQLRL